MARSSHRGLSREACGLGVGVYALEGEQQSLGTLGRTACTAKGTMRPSIPTNTKVASSTKSISSGSDRNAYLAFHAVGFGECCGSQESVGGYHLFFFFLPEGVGACLNSLSLTVAVSRVYGTVRELRKSENTRASSALSFAEARECFLHLILQS